MMVCGHGDVADYCKEHDLSLCDTYNGDLEKYTGVFRVLVTDQDMSECEYYFLKGKLLGRGVELISTRHKDDALMSGYLVYANQRQKKNYGGRQIFGYCRKNGEIVPIEGSLAVVDRILEMRDAGYTLRAIREDAGVRHPDGRKISVSTIQLIIKNREKYEER